MGVAETQTLAGRYRVLRTLASGGMGTVVLAEDERLGREVAIKRMHAEGTGSDGLARFRREARIGASLSHRNLVRIYDAIVEGPDIMIVMEYVPGRSLAEVLREGRPDRATALRVLRDMAAGLDHAHEHGVLHRDIKPGNVLLTEDGQAKLGDLGIATAAESTRITTTGSVMGTAAYLAPEQLDGRSATPASDVYALAAVAYELLGGRRARTGRTPLEIVRQATAGPPPDLREIDPEVPAGAATVVGRGMAPEPEARPAGAGAFVDELSRELEAAVPETAPVAVAAPVVEPVPERAPTAVTPTPAPRPAPVPPRARVAAAAAPPAPARRRTRVLPLLAFGLAAAAVLVVLAVAGLGGSGGDGQDRAAADPTPQARDDGEARDSSSGSGGAAAPSAEATEDGGSAAAPAPSGEGEATATGEPGADPAATVRAFYERTAADDFSGAWELAGDDLRAEWGGSQQQFASDGSLRSLESITFKRLEVTEQQGDTATVAVSTRAKLSDRTDRCTGTIATSRGPDGWRVGRLNFNCRSRPA